MLYSKIYEEIFPRRKFVKRFSKTVSLMIVMMLISGVSLFANSNLVEKSFTYSGYEVSVASYDGYALIEYPDVLSREDVVAFLSMEAGKYSDEASYISYSFVEDGVLRLDYPEGLSAELRSSLLDVFGADIISAASAFFPTAFTPEVLTYNYAGYSITVTLYENYADIAYPAFVTESDVTAFFAYELALRGSDLEGATYSFIGNNTVSVNYPLSVDVDTALFYVPVLINDFVAYVSDMLASSEAEYESAALVAEEDESAEEVAEDSVYPFGVTPIVKSDDGLSEFDLYIVHVNDVHGRIEEGTDGSLGYSKFRTLLEMGRTVTDNILVLDAGDTLHGTNFANMFEGQTIADILKIIGFDAMVPGNHDFNYGSDRLREVAEWAEDEDTFRILSANITDENGYLVFQPYQVFDYNGFKVCVIGLTTPDTKTKSHPKNTEGLDFMSDVVVQSAQDFLDFANELCDFVIVLGHLGIVPDGESGITSTYICENLNGIDLLVDGHSHTVMDGGEEVNGTLIVSTGNYLNNIGIVRVHVKDGVGEIADAFLLPAEDVEDPANSAILKAYGVSEVPSDPEIDRYIEAKNEELDDVLKTVVAYLPMDLNGERSYVRTRKTNLAKIITDAMTAESGADFTIINGGGIRASLSAGPVTIGDINDVLPFTNTITVCEISPAGVYEALEHGYSMLPEENGGFSQTDLRVVYSASAPVGERIKRVYLGEELLDRDDTTTMYKVATNDFMAAGGDGYTMFGRVLTEGSMLNEVFISYLQDTYPLI